jgi:hypothetical protein
MLHLVSANQHRLLPLYEKGIIGLEQHVPVPTVLHIDLHDVPVLAEDVLSRGLNIGVFLNTGGLVSGQDLPPSTMSEVQGLGK